MKWRHLSTWRMLNNPPCKRKDQNDRAVCWHSRRIFSLMWMQYILTCPRGAERWLHSKCLLHIRATRLGRMLEIWQKEKWQCLITVANTYCFSMAGTTLCTLHALSFNPCHNPVSTLVIPLTLEETEAQRGEETCPKLHSKKWSQHSKPGLTS